MAETRREEAKNELYELFMYVEHAFTEEHKRRAIDALKKAIYDMEKQDRIENTRPIDLIKEFGDLDAEKFNKISHWFSQAQKFEKIEQLVEDWNNEAVKESRAFGYMIEIEKIVRE